MLRLLVEPAQGEPFERALESEELLIGRSSDCGLTISDRFMSRRHARLFRRGDAWLVEDLGSRNGTIVDGLTIDSASAVGAGSEITLSGSIVRLEDPERPHSWRIAAADGATGGHTIFREASELLASQAALPAESARSLELLNSHAERLQLLNELHQLLARALTVEDLLDTLLGRVFDVLRPEDGVVVLEQPDGSYAQVARRAAGGYQQQHSLSKTLVHEVAERGRAALVLDIDDDERFAAAESIVASGVRSLIAAPLADADGSLGMIALSSHLHRHEFSEQDLGLLTSLGAVAALRLRNLALADEAAQRRRLEHEVELARAIQIGLLPDELPRLPGYEMYGDTVPSQGVSGDFYEIVHDAASGLCALVIADVSGKGISASLLTASIEALLVGPLEAGEPPDRICAQVSQRVFTRTPAAKYATAIIAILEPASGRLIYCNAGHNAALVIRAQGQSAELSSTGPPLGLLPNATFSTQEIVVAPGDLVLFYTDGITEAEAHDDEEFGLERLRAIGIEHRADSPAELAAALNQALDSFVDGKPFADDRTLVVLRRLPSA